MVDNNEIFYDTVRYMEPVSKELIIANTGQVPARFIFIKKLDDASYCKDWLHIEPYKCLIAPGNSLIFFSRTTYTFRSRASIIYRNHIFKRLF